MPSMPEPSATSALQAITNSTFGANTLKSLLESPLHFEKSTLPTNTGISGRYTPLNKPVNYENGTTNGLRNGVQASRESSLDDTASSEGSQLDDTPHVNGDKAAVANLKDGVFTEWPRPLRRPPGLRNFGNTCYMNSTLQALMHIPPLVTYCINRKHEENCSKSPRSCIFCRFERHARDSYPPPMQRPACLDPTGIIGKYGVLQKFYSYNKQEDSHEFLIHLLDKMDEAEKKAHRDPKYKSIIQEIFGGECRQSITCDRENCRHVSHTSQAFMDLSLDLLIRERDILSSLADFTKQETLSQDNQYKCEKCNGKSRAKKVTKIHKAPPILTIHMKRFAASGMRKNQTQIQYPELLDLSPYMYEESRGVPKYRLIATVCHHAFDYTGMKSGHYTANCKSASGTWNHFDDTQIGSVKLNDVLRDRDAYILFYARDDSGGSPGSSEGSVKASNDASGPSPTKKLVNGFTETSRPSSSGQKRSLDEDRKTESPSKRPRPSDDEDEHPKSQPAKREKSREPLATVANGFLSPASPRTTDPFIWKPFQAPNVQRPKQLSKTPPQSSSPKPDIRHPYKTFQFSKDSGQQRSGKPSHRITPLLTTESNPYVESDPFAAGVYLGQQRQNEKQKSQHPRPKYPGIGSQLVPGSTQAFSRQEKTLAQRSDLGIRFNKGRSGR